MSGPADMTSSYRPRGFRAWTLAYRGWSHLWGLGCRPRARSRPRQRRLPGVDRSLVALIALPRREPRDCVLLDPRYAPLSITNCTYCTLEQTTLLDSRLLHSDVIDIVYNLRISPVLCGPYTQGLQRPRFVNFGSSD